jgi:katanin p60 ATPase-containing subunit A1
MKDFSFRNIIYLIAEYLKEAGLNKAYAALIDESQLSTDFTVCDNVDLETIYLEFSSYYSIKFGKKPRFVKKSEQQQNSQKLSSISSVDTQHARQALAKRRSTLKTASNVVTIAPEIQSCDLETSLQVTSLSPPPATPFTVSQHGDSNGIFIKSMRDFLSSHPQDWRDMSEMIIKDVIRKNLCVKWDDIVGLEDAKMIIKESVIFPMKYPQLFNQMQPWRGK